MGQVGWLDTFGAGASEGKGGEAALSRESYYIKQRCSGDLSIRSVDLDETLQGSSGYISKNFLFWGQPCPKSLGL